MRTVVIEADFANWREAARELILAEVPPGEVLWEHDAQGALPFAARTPDSAAGTFRVAREFIAAAKLVAHHRNDDRFALLYRVVWRLTHGEGHLMAVAVDEDVQRLTALAKEVRRDAHKMKAFVRFRQVQRDGAAHYIAWHRPEHFIVPLVAPFFAERFSGMSWSILTPDASVSWDGAALTLGPGLPRSAAPAADELESLWLTYYASIFNPNRIKLNAMRAEMPLKHWATLPETRIIDDLLREAPARVEAMMAGRKSATSDCEPAATSAAAYVPAKITLPTLREASRKCTGCDLYCDATQTVFGEGPSDAVAVFIGEQPGDKEDLAGKPFVGPAGKMLDEVLADVGIDRSLVYVTNAVKHFKFEQRGKRRIHAKPNAREIGACRPWLEAELAAIKPAMIVCLGATAARALMGPAFRVMKERGKIFDHHELAPWLMATLHPSALLRIPDDAAQHQAIADFTSDLRAVAKKLKAEMARAKRERGHAHRHKPQAGVEYQWVPG